MFELEDLHPHQVLLALSLLHWTRCFAGSAGGAVPLHHPHVTLLGPGQVPALHTANIFLQQRLSVTFKPQTLRAETKRSVLIFSDFKTKPNRGRESGIFSDFKTKLNGDRETGGTKPSPREQGPFADREQLSTPPRAPLSPIHLTGAALAHWQAGTRVLGEDSSPLLLVPMTTFVAHLRRSERVFVLAALQSPSPPSLRRP